MVGSPSQGGSMSDSLFFRPSEPLTLGVEIEVQLLDQKSLDLVPKSPLMLHGLSKFGDRVKAELFQSMLEFNTKVCRNAHEVRIDLGETIDAAIHYADSLGVRLASSGTHPFALYSDRILYPAQRYQDLIDRNQWIARRLMIFGMHVHIGMRDGDHAIRMNNALLHYCPILLALSTSSPYWHGEDTELASSRITFFEAIPTGGHPCQTHSWSDFSELYLKLYRSGAVRSPKDLWWDIRPSPDYGTLEIRICDGLSTLDETVALTALIHSLSIYIDRQLQQGRIFQPPPDWILRENKWRASRWGTDSKLIVNLNGDAENLSVIVNQLLDELKPIAEEYNYGAEFSLIAEIQENGTSSQRQRIVSRSSVEKSLMAVTDFNAREFVARRPLWAGKNLEISN